MNLWIAYYAHEEYGCTRAGIIGAFRLEADAIAAIKAWVKKDPEMRFESDCYWVEEEVH